MYKTTGGRHNIVVIYMILNVGYLYRLNVEKLEHGSMSLIELCAIYHKNIMSNLLQTYICKKKKKKKKKKITKVIKNTKKRVYVQSTL